MPITIERTRAKLIADYALGDIIFQNGMKAAGIADTDSDTDIQTFMNEAEGFLTPVQTQTLTTLFPIGYLTSFWRMRSLSHDIKPEKSIVGDFHRLKNRIITRLPNSPISKRFEEHKKNTFFGIGCSTELDPTNLALAYLIYIHGERPASSDWLADRLFYPGASEDPEGLHLVTIAVSRLRKRLPPGIRIMTEKAELLGDPPGYRWANAFGLAA